MQHQPQVFPEDLLSPTYPDPNNPDRLLGRSEFERRSVYTSHLKKKLDLMGGREHRLVGVVRECLANNPQRRLTTSDLLSSLEEVGTETEGGLLQLDIARVRTVRSLRAKERRIQELEVRSLNKCVYFWYSGFCSARCICVNLSSVNTCIWLIFREQ